MKLLVFLVVFVFIAIAVFFNPNVKKHQAAFRDELNIILKNYSDNDTDNPLLLNKFSENQIDSLVQSVDYFIFSRTQFIVNDRLATIGVGFCGKVWLNNQSDVLLKNLALKIVNKTKYFNLVEVCADERADSTVKIGNQIWMKKDFERIVYNNGDSIPEVTNDSVWNNLKTGAWCYIDNDSNNLKRRGRLYNWYAINDPRGLVPKDFRVPNVEDWKELMFAMGDSTNRESNFLYSNRVINKLVNIYNFLIFKHTVGFKLKKPIGWSVGANGSNESGFSAVQAGDRTRNGHFTYDNAHWWCERSSTAENAKIFFIGMNSNLSYVIDAPKSYGFTIRLLKRK